MQKYFEMPIKDVIERFPRVGEVLMAYGVDCATCSVGVCPLKDVVSIHHLSPEEEKEIMAAVAAVFDPSLPQPALPSAPPAKKRKPRASVPIRQLVDEHDNIKRWITAAAALTPQRVGSEAGRKFLGDGIDFVRSYADRFHHAKEEDILFELVDKNSAIVRAMFLEHDEGRALVRQAVSALERGDTGAALSALQAHGSLLVEHIRKEDEILYPWIDRALTRGQVDDLVDAFQKVDMDMDRGTIDRCLRFAREAAARAAKL